MYECSEPFLINVFNAAIILMFYHILKSLLFLEFFLDGIGNAQINLQYFLHQHIDHLIFIFLIILLDFLDFFSCFLLQGSLKFFISFLNCDRFTSALSLSNSASFSLRYLLTSTSAASRASLSLRCLNNLKRRKNHFPRKV